MGGVKATVPFLTAGVLCVAVLWPAIVRAAEDDVRPVAAAHDEIIEVVGPTLIAFFPRVTDRMVEENPGLIDLLDDFYHHLNAIGQNLVTAGVRIYARPVGEIRILDRGRVRTLTPPPEGSDLGYYMVAPGLEAKLVLGVYTDVDLMEAVDRHLPAGPSPYGAFGNSDSGSIAYPSAGDGRWAVIVQAGDRNNIEFWLSDRRSADQPVRIPVGPGRHGEVTWHGDEIFEISLTGLQHPISRFVHVKRPEKPFEVTNLLHYDDVERIYVSYFAGGVEIGRLFEDGGSSKERFSIELDYESAVDARMAIESVAVEDECLIVIHRRRDGSEARESFTPTLLQR